jgi:hypothetical protein
VGSQVGYNSSSAYSNNTAMGFKAGYNLTGNSNVMLGYMAGAYEFGSNSFYIDNQDRTNTAGDKAGALMYGIFDANPANQKLTINGSVGIGTTSPAVKLDVNGEMKIKKNSAQPYTCDAAHDSAISLTNKYTTCVCKNGSGWVLTADGTTACTWN